MPGSWFEAWSTAALAPVGVKQPPPVPRSPAGVFYDSRNYWDAGKAYHDPDGGYVSFMSSDDDHRAPANYGANYERLAAVKATYDPDNFFHINQNISPADGS